MKTIQDIRHELAEAGKPVSVAQLYRYFRRFNIHPISNSTRPKFYPNETAWFILEGLGLVNNPCHLGLHAPNEDGFCRDCGKKVDCEQDKKDGSGLITVSEALRRAGR